MENMSFEQELTIYGMAYLDGTRVSVKGIEGLTEQEARGYLSDIKKQYPHETVKGLDISPAKGDNVSINFDLQPPPFERIRRITGNPAKKARKVA